LAPEKIDGIVRTMLIHHKAKGFLPIWTAWGQDNYCMIGNHAIPMILSAFQNGFRGFDVNDALKAIVETSTKSHVNSDWELYNQYGYYPFDKLDNEAVSRTLESGYDDWCVAEMAKKIGNNEIEKTFAKRAKYYKNLYDKETTFFRGKDSKGMWRTPFNPLIATSPMNNPGDYTEANAWQYFWTPAQYEINGVTELLGGKYNFTKKLNEFFSTEAVNPDKFLGQEAMIGQYAHGNEPSHHIIYLFAYSNEPKKGQKYIHQVINEFHDIRPDGMIGNDDCGQMSAWYILSILGFYPVNPANGEFVLGSPQVKKATIHLAGDKKIYNWSQKLF
jgi:predicted alpha-1,2-mannosidase